MANKFYAVKKGLTSSIYNTWEECKANVDGVSGAEFKSFKTEEEAREYLGLTSAKEEVVNSELHSVLKEKKLTAYVDGSFNKATQMHGSGIVLIADDFYGEISLPGKENDEYAEMWNVGGEIKAAIYATTFAETSGYSSIDLYYDYAGIENWATEKWKANKPATKNYQEFMKNRKIKINFHKVAAHTGVKYNEIADTLAKKASGIID